MVSEMRGKVTVECRKLHDEWHYLSSYHNVVRKIRSRKIEYVGHVTHFSEARNTYTIFCWKSSREETSRKTYA